MDSVTTNSSFAHFVGVHYGITSQSARSATLMAGFAPLADKLLASLTQFTHSMMLAQNHTRRQAPSAHLATDTARFARAKSHTKAGVICPSLALLASSAPWRHIWAPPSGKTLLASLAQNHIQRQVSSAHRSRCSLVAPPGGRYGRHLVAR